VKRDVSDLHDRTAVPKHFKTDTGAKAFDEGDLAHGIDHEWRVLESGEVVSDLDGGAVG
jgi:hypothetical protein